MLDEYVDIDEINIRDYSSENIQKDLIQDALKEDD
jgi:hypothetical protein